MKAHMDRILQLYSEGNRERDLIYAIYLDGLRRDKLQETMTLLTGGKLLTYIRNPKDGTAQWDSRNGRYLYLVIDNEGNACRALATRNDRCLYSVRGEIGSRLIEGFADGTWIASDEVWIKKGVQYAPVPAPIITDRWHNYFLKAKKHQLPADLMGKNCTHERIGEYASQFSDAKWNRGTGCFLIVDPETGFVMGRRMVSGSHGGFYQRVRIQGGSFNVHISYAHCCAIIV